MPQAETPVLIIQEGALAGQCLSIDKASVMLGRGSDCDIVLPERQVSRHHLRIFSQGDSYFVEDLRSKNGTFLNGQPVEDGPVRLQDGDEIQVALAVRLRFVGSDATLPLDFDLSEAMAPSGRLVLDPRTRDVRLDNRTLDPPLSVPQYRLLERLIEAGEQVVSRDDVIAAVWPDDASSGVSGEAIDALVRRLRDRLAELDADHNYIQTVRGHGFRYVRREL